MVDARRGRQRVRKRRGISREDFVRIVVVRLMCSRTLRQQLDEHDGKGNIDKQNEHHQLLSGEPFLEKT